MKAEHSCSSSNPDGTARSFANQRGQQHRCANSPTGLQGCWRRPNKKPTKLSVCITEWHAAVHLADALQQLRLHCLGLGFCGRRQCYNHFIVTLHDFNPCCLTVFVRLCHPVRLVSGTMCCLRHVFHFHLGEFLSCLPRDEVTKTLWKQKWGEKTLQMMIFNPLHTSKTRGKK